MKPPEKGSSQPPEQGTKPPADKDDDRTQFIAAPAAPQPPAPPPQQTAPPDNDRTAFAPLPTPRSAVTHTHQGPAIVGVGTLVNNNYEITEVLKSGGMGEVYRGIEIGTGDPVAIKAILPELAEDEKAGLLFKREARTLRQLADEAIVRYYNYVHDRDLDRYFLVMEFIEGVPLSDHIKTHGKLAVPAVFTLIKRLSKGLEKAHAQDVVHRDLSPDNVMLTGGAVSEARLIDFGIAKSNVLAEGTMHGQFAGKFKYVAPEQLGHFDSKIGPATDIYGLALLSAAAAIGEPLDMGNSIVAAAQSRQSIPDLSDVPEQLRPILSHMLEPDPDDRPASMMALRQMLENPALIPEKYRAGLPLPPAVETTRHGTQGLGMVAPLAAPHPGLQVPMMTAGPQTLTGVTQAGTVTQPANAGLDDDEESGGHSALGLLMLAFVVIFGAVGFVAWQSGMLQDQADVEPENAAPDVPAETGLAAVQKNTRAGFLADFSAGDCTYFSRVATGSNAGMVEGFSATGGDFPGLSVAYEEKFGARPAILPRQVETAQCAALAFTRALQGRGREAPQLELSTDRIASGEAIRARVGSGRGNAVWAALITPAGGVFNLTSRLSAPSGGARSLDFGLNLAEGAAAVPQLMLIVTSDQPLARTATAADGSSASDLLPLILQEIVEANGTASASLGYVLLDPPKPQVAPEQEDDATEEPEALPEE